MAVDESQQRPRIPHPLPSWEELNRRVASLSEDVLSRLELAESLLRTSTAYGGHAIDSPSAPYTSATPVVIAPWDVSIPGPPTGSEAVLVTLNAAAGTITPQLAGVYQMSAAVSGAGTAGALYTLDLFHNGARRIGFSVDQSNQSVQWTLAFGFIIDLQASDIIDLRLSASASTTINHATFTITKTGLTDTDLTRLETP